jgi:P-type conjugative transfer protein TrbG
MIHHRNASVCLFLLLAGAAGATENVEPEPADEVVVPNIPTELMAPPPAEDAPEETLATAGTAQKAEENSDRAESAPRPAPLVPAPINIGPPARRAILESHQWAENPAAMPELDSGGRVVFAFSESAPTIVCAPMRVCDIELQPGEVVQGAPHIGDSVRWKIGPAVSGSGEQQVTHLIVKPTEAGLDTNLVVPTDRRTYHLRLVSSSRHYVSSVAFDYPEDHQQSWQNFAKASARRSDAAPASTDMPTVAVNRLNFNYRIKVVEGKPTFKPLRAMDDGYHTYIAMNEEMPQWEAPVLVGISPDGAEQMINYRLKGNMYVIDGTQFKLALISGVGRQQQRVELTRDPCQRRGWLGICWDAKE